MCTVEVARNERQGLKMCELWRLTTQEVNAQIQKFHKQNVL